MRKNKMMRTAAVLGVATMLTASVLSGTFAKYSTTAEGTDTARVAKWGLNDSSSITLTNLFENAYKNGSDGTTGVETVKSGENGKDVIAPGTSGSATFAFKYAGTNGEGSISAPEVGYTFNVSTGTGGNGSSCDALIKANKNIVWSLDGAECAAENNKTSWDVLLEKIQALDGNVAVADSKPADYQEPNTLPKAFYGEGSGESITVKADKTHTVSWTWKFENESGSSATTNYWVKENTTDNKEGVK